MLSAVSKHDHRPSDFGCGSVNVTELLCRRVANRRLTGGRRVPGAAPRGPSPIVALLVVLALPVALFVLFDDSRTAVGTARAQSPGAGNAMTIGSVLPDSYDPVLFQTVQANQPLQMVYTGLVTYKHESGPAGTEVIPGLAEALPTVSADGQTYTFRLREGLKYSDGSPVKASDFEHTIKRLNYLGGPFSSFTSSIAGVRAYVEARRANADISGITADDATRVIVVRLVRPDTTFLRAIALPSAAPTPAAQSPFTESAHIPGLGPYTISFVDPDRAYVLNQTPGWSLPGIPSGNLTAINVVKSTVPAMTRDVMNNKLDFITEDPTGNLLRQVKANYRNRFRMDANPPNTFWFFMNETVKPFDKLAVRRAVNYAIDSRVLRRILDGRLQPTCNFLPPGYATIGYKKITPCPYGDPAGPPQLAKARTLVAKSGYKGMKVTVWGPDNDRRPAITAYLRDVMVKIGFKAKTKIVALQDYFGTVGDRKIRAQAGFTDWYSDYPHPADFFAPNLSANALASSPTFNFAFRSHPVVDKALKKLAADDPSKVAAQWAKVDKSVINNADVAVYGNELSTSFFSDRMDVKKCSGVSPVYKNDWLLFCLK
jgi:peptide/nickel transport system substrate-binding protein